MQSRYFTQLKDAGYTLCITVLRSIIASVNVLQLEYATHSHNEYNLN